MKKKNEDEQLFENVDFIFYLKILEDFKADKAI